MSPEEILQKLKDNRNKIQNKMLSQRSLNSNLFDMLTKDLKVAQSIVGANNHDFSEYVRLRLLGKI